MPLYEYRCTHCGDVIEVLTSCETDLFLLPTCKKCAHLMERKLSMFTNMYTPTRNKVKDDT